jgi:predicted nucleic acid-binding protein
MLLDDSIYIILATNTSSNFVVSDENLLKVSANQKQ